MKKRFNFDTVGLIASVLLCCFLCVSCVSCSDPDPRSEVSRIMEVNCKKGRLISHSDTHGGFLGDGVTVTVIDMSAVRDDFLEQTAEWKRLPLPDELYEAVYLFGAIEPDPIPPIQNGRYKLVNRHEYAGGRRSETLEWDYSWNFSVAIYDEDTDLLYFYELDT